MRIPAIDTVVSNTSRTNRVKILSLHGHTDQDLVEQIQVIQQGFERARHPCGPYGERGGCRQRQAAGKRFLMRLWTGALQLNVKRHRQTKAFHVTVAGRPVVPDG